MNRLVAMLLVVLSYSTVGATTYYVDGVAG